MSDKKEKRRGLDEIMSSSPYARKMGWPETALEFRKPEYRQLRECMLKSRMRNAVLVGPAGCGKTELVRMLSVKDPDTVYVEVSVAAMLSGTEYRGQFEERAVELFEAVSSDPRPVTVFVDECHMMWGAGKLEGGCVDLVNILKPYLSSGAVTVIGATTPKEFAHTIARDPAFMRRVTPISVGEPDGETTLRIAKAFSGGRIPDRMAKSAIEKAAAIGYWSSNPDRAIECLDRAMAKAEFEKRKPRESDIDEALADMEAAFRMAEEFLKEGDEGPETGGKRRK